MIFIGKRRCLKKLLIREFIPNCNLRFSVQGKQSSNQNIQFQSAL